MAPRVIWCLGMYASASTWLFNVVRHIAEARPGDVRTVFVSPQTNPAELDRPGLILVKSHEIADEARLIGIAGRADRIFITTRDPRDAVASLIQYHRHDFDRALNLVEAVARLCGDFAKDQRVRVFGYETRFFETVTTVEALARSLGENLSQAAAQDIFNRLDRTAVEAHIASLPDRKDVLRDPLSGDFLDPRTHWHTHHAGRSGESGRWRSILTPGQAAEVRRRVPS